MHIVDAKVTVQDVDAAAAWFTTVLGLPVHRDGADAVVTLGRSTLVLTPGPDPGGSHHLAFAVRPEDFDDVLALARATLDPLEADGSDIVEGPDGWRSRSVYFTGPEGMVLEHIAREAHRGLAAPTATAHGSPGVLSLNEVGIGVEDVPTTVRRLRDEAGLPPYPPQGPQFAPVGDPDGLLIVAQEDRTWFPTDHDLPSRGPLVVTLAGRGPEVALGARTVVRHHG